MHVCGVYLNYLTTDAWPQVQVKVAESRRLQQVKESREEAVKPSSSDKQTDPGSSTPSETTTTPPQKTDATNTDVKTQDIKSDTEVKPDESQVKPDVSQSEPETKKSKAESSRTKTKSKDGSKAQKSKADDKTYYSMFIGHCMRTKAGLDTMYMMVEYYCKMFWRSKRCVIGALIVTNLPLALYTSVLHQRGTLDVMKYIADQSMRTVDGQQSSVMYLMPCHSTPYYV
jgi:hypothetical protein